MVSLRIRYAGRRKGKKDHGEGCVCDKKDRQDLSVDVLRPAVVFFREHALVLQSFREGVGSPRLQNTRVFLWTSHGTNINVTETPGVFRHGPLPAGNL